MKQKALFLGLICAIMSLTACSDDDVNTNPNVPLSVQQAFNNRFKGVNDVKWDKVNNYHVARFNGAITRNTSTTYSSSAWFTDNGEYCQSDEDIEFAALPLLVQDSFNAYKELTYPDWTIDECEVLVREGMSLVYVIEIENGDLEREISISELGDILKDVLDDDDEDEILPIMIPDELKAALQNLFPETYTSLEILELDIDDDEIEVDIMESNRHKEIEFDALYNLVSIEYKISFDEAKELIKPETFEKLVAMAQQAGIDLFAQSIQENMEIELKETANGQYFEVEIEINDQDYEFKIDENGNIVVSD